MDYLALRNELLAGPDAATLYAPHIAAGSDHRLAQLLNAPKVGVTTPVGVVPSSAVAAALNGTELAGLTNAQRDTLRVYLTPQEFEALPGSGGRVYLLSLFGPGSATRAALTGLVDRMGSRAEELGLGTVTDVDVATALRPPQL